METMNKTKACSWVRAPDNPLIKKYIMSKVGTKIIDLAEKAVGLLDGELKPEYLDTEMQSLLNPDDFGFYMLYKDTIIETMFLSDEN